jgi:hypothetical protein
MAWSYHSLPGPTVGLGWTYNIPCPTHPYTIHHPDPTIHPRLLRSNHPSMDKYLRKTLHTILFRTTTIITTTTNSLGLR